MEETKHPSVYLIYHACCLNNNAQILVNRRWSLMLRNSTLSVQSTRLSYTTVTLLQVLCTP